MKVRYTGPARQDVVDLLNYTRRHWPHHVERIRDRLNEVDGLLARFPEAGPLTERPGIRRHGLKPFPYVVFYRVMPAELVIVRVYHTAQKPFDTGGP